MGLSTGRDLHIDQHLTNVAINYRPTGMIADMIAPIVPVNKESDIFPVFSRKEAFAIENTVRARGTPAKRITRSVSSNGYQCRNFALAYSTPIEDYANMDAAYEFELESGASRFLIDKLFLDWDKRVLQQVGSATNVATGFLTGSSWIASSNAGDPFSMLMSGIEQQTQLTTQRPNSLLFGWKAWNYLRRNVNMRNLINGTNNGRGPVTRQQVQDVFEVERLLVSQAFYNSANEAQAESLANTFPADAVLLYFAPMAPSRETPSFMYSFRWSNPQLPAPLVVERHPYDTKTKTQDIEAGYYQDEKLTGSDYGALLLGVGSAQANGLT